MNTLTVSGYLTSDIETRAAGEHQVHHFTIAVNQNDRTTFLPTEAWNMPHLERFLRKGSRVLVRGALKQENWENAKVSGAANCSRRPMKSSFSILPAI